MSIIQKILGAAGIEYKAAGDALPLSSFSFQNFSMMRRGKTSLTEATASEAYRYHELVFACINKTADVMSDAEIIVEKKTTDGEWERVEGHLLSALFKRPNSVQTGRDIRKLMAQSESCAGITYLQINRSGAGIPVEIVALNPHRVRKVWNGDRSEILCYEYMLSSGRARRINREDLLIRRRADLLNQLDGFAPVVTALKSINSDIGLSDYIDAFFESDGTPSGILKVLNRTLNQTEAEALQTQWRAKFGRNGSNQKGTAVLDQNAEYQKIGANLNELAADSVSDRNESRICSVFGVPPILVGALVGLKYTTANATAKSALRDFWDNKISPELAGFREWLTWYVLPEFEDLEAIKREQIRVGFDISQAAFLQEDVDKIHARARENIKAGFWTLNEARTATGMMPDERGDYYLQPLSLSAVSPENRAIEAVKKVEVGTEPKEVAAVEEAVKNAITEIESSIILNSLPEKKTKKTYDYDGLTLGREPKGVELIINLKSLVSDFETEKERATKILTTFRDELISQAVEEIEKLKESEIYALTLSPNPKTRKQIEKVLRSAYLRGKAQVVAELNAQKSAKGLEKSIEKKDLEDDDDITRFSDSVIAKIINEIQQRAVNGYVSFTLLKLSVEEIISKLRDLLDDETIRYIEQTAGIAVNSSIQSGRRDEMADKSDEIKFYQYSAILDRNTCQTCEEADETEADSPDDLPDAPNPNCSGFGNCRCFIVAVIV